MSSLISKVEEIEETQQSLPELFGEIKKKITKLTNDNGADFDDDMVNNLIKSIVECMRSVDVNALFSKNEELDDIPTSSLQYLLLDFYLAKSYGLIKDLSKRKDALLSAKENYKRFWSLSCSKNVLSKSEIEETEDSEMIDNSPAAIRERKIAEFKRDKAVRQRIAELEAILKLHQQSEGKDRLGYSVIDTIVLTLYNDNLYYFRLNCCTIY